VEQSSVNESGTFVSGPLVQRTVTLGRPPKEPAITGCGPAFVPTSYLGIETMQQVHWNFPIKVSVHTTNIGGPSAGLAMALGIMDKLSGGHLTGGRTVAATGTIDENGAVGDVGGVAQKTIAAEQAGASVFFVPPQELAAAKSKATPKLHVYAVSNLDQALFLLKALGGTIPASHVQAQAAP
jgi:PDZ domain-containing protein